MRAEGWRTVCITALMMCVCFSAYAEPLPWLHPPVTLDAQKAAIDKHLPSAAIAKTPFVTGWLEYAYVPDIAQTTRAKLDSGAKTSAINANIIKIFKRDGKEYALFRLDLDEATQAKPIERNIVRWVRIKQKKAGELQRRPVVNLTFCIANIMLKGEVSLAKRDHFHYNILVGRNMLQKHFAIDASRTFTVKPRCP